MVYRGLGGINLPACFEVCEEGGGRGGSDFGFLSTTTKKEVAVSYIGDKVMPALFMIEVGDLDRGASISFLSQVCVCVHGWRRHVCCRAFACFHVVLIGEKNSVSASL